MNTREHYDRASQIVRDVIARWNPYQLNADDEAGQGFDREIAELLPRLQRARSSAEVSEAVLRVFGETFAEAGFDVGTCARVGEEIYARMSHAGLYHFGSQP